MNRSRLVAALSDGTLAHEGIAEMTGLFGIGARLSSEAFVQAKWLDHRSDPESLDRLKRLCERVGVPFIPSEPTLAFAHLGAALAPGQPEFVKWRSPGRPKGSFKRAATIQRVDRAILCVLEKFSASTSRSMNELIAKAATVGIREGFVHETRTSYIRRLRRAHAALCRERYRRSNSNARIAP